PREDPRPADAGRLSLRRLRERADDRQPHQTPEEEAHGSRSCRGRGDRDRLRPRLSPARAVVMRPPLPFRLTTRLLLFNLLLVFLPVSGLFYLDLYERELLTQQEKGMVQQGRLLAAALGSRETL